MNMPVEKKQRKKPTIQVRDNGKFRVQFTRNGVAHDKSFSRLEDAEAYVDLHAGDSLTFRGFVEGVYKNSSGYLALSPKSRNNYDSKLAAACRIIGDVPLTAVDRPTIDRWLRVRSSETTRRGTQPRSTTRRIELVIIGVVLNCAVEYGYMTSNPASTVKKPAAEKRHVRVSPEERLNMLQLAKGHWVETVEILGKPVEIPLSPRAIEAGRYLYCLSECGGRASELGEGLIANLDLAAGTLWVPKTKTGDAQLRYFSPVGVRLLKEQLRSIENHPHNEKGYIFPSELGTPHSYQYSVKLARKLKVVDAQFHAHATKREFISSAREAGVSDADLQKVVGNLPSSLAQYDESTGATELEKARRDRFFQQRVAELRDAAGEAKAQAELAEALRSEQLVGREIMALDNHYAAKVAPPPKTPAEVLAEALASGQLTQADVLKAVLDTTAQPKA